MSGNQDCIAPHPEVRGTHGFLQTHITIPEIHGTLQEACDPGHELPEALGFLESEIQTLLAGVHELCHDGDVHESRVLGWPAGRRRIYFLQRDVMQPGAFGRWGADLSRLSRLSFSLFEVFCDGTSAASHLCTTAGRFMVKRRCKRRMEEEGGRLDWVGETT